MSDQNDDLSLRLVKIIPASITIFLCFILIITYFISFLQVKFNIFVKEDLKERITKENRYSHSSFNEKAGIPSKEEENKTTKKIGLGSHYMFYLILSHFFGGITELIYLIKNYNYKLEPKALGCQIFGLLHNFFDLSSVCWTTMLTYLFYKSTNLSSEILYKDYKYLFIGFIYWLFSCLILCVIPYFRDAYGFSNTYCAFRKNDNGDHELFFWIYFFIFIIFLNSIFNCFWLYKTTIYYSKKLKNLQRQNIKEYAVLLIFVRVFQIFPIVLVITRIIKFVSVIFLIFGIEDSTGIFVYLNGFFFNINGALNSLACIYFFRGVFWCCFENKDKVDDTNSNEKNIYNNLYENNENIEQLNQ
jgi:hypothetical protein